MKQRCGICKFYEHLSGYCDAPMPESVIHIGDSDERWIKSTEGKNCDTFKLACANCYEDCKNAGNLLDFPKVCKLITRK